MNRLPPLNSLKSFEAAARRGSFQLAADELFVTPSAVSHQIKALEAFLGLELFIRHARRITLTQIGEDYFRSVQQALQEIEHSTQRLMSSHQMGELHLSMVPAFLTRWLLPRISSFYDKYPDIHLEMTSTLGLVDFDSSETDMAVYFGVADWSPDIETHFLKHHQHSAVCSPKLLEKTPLHSLKDISNHRLLHVTKRNDEWKSWFNEAGIPFKENKKGMGFSSGALTSVAAINGLGVALADLALVSEELESGKLVSPFNVTVKNDKSFHLVYPKKRAMTYAMTCFKDWLMDEMNKEMISEIKLAELAAINSSEEETELCYS